MSITRTAWVVLVVSVFSGWLHWVEASPFTPTDDAQVLERLPFRPSDPAARQLREWRAEWMSSPDRFDLAARLARGYIEQGRRNADPRYNGYAEATLTRWWKSPNPPTALLVLRATLSQSRHDFNGALADLTQVLKRDPDDPQAWVTQALILQVQGEYQKSKESCFRLQRLSTTLVTAACLAGAGSLSGQAEKSFDLLKKMVDQYSPPILGGVRGGNAEEQLWARTLLAEIAARRGMPAAAEDQFRQAFLLKIHDPYLLGAYADFLLDQGRAKEVLPLLADEMRADGLLLRLTLAEQTVHADSFSQHRDALRDRFAASRLRGDRVHQREESRFTLWLLHQPQEALKLAEENWKVQREPWDARVLLEAAQAANNHAAAKTVLDWMAKTKIEDVTLTKLKTELEK
ncbi:MAG: hypothetical protein HY037_05085 [Nitrospirae bacterium]|nr:hypothetical protein [Candidatus Troglogloeales bacterium]